MTRLDDLLTYEDDTRRRGSEHGVAYQVIVSIFVLIASSWVLWELLKLLGVGAPYVFVVGLLATLIMLHRILRWIAAEKLPATLRDVPPDAPRADEQGEDGMREAVRRWESRLDWTRRDVRRFSAVVQPAFADIVDERLRLRHGIDRATDPVRAQQFVGPQLWKFLHEPINRTATPQEIAALVEQMEAL